MFFSVTSQLDQTLHKANETLKQVSGTFFSGRSMLALVVSLTIAFILGRIVADALRRVTVIIGAQADKTKDLNRVNKLRRIETLIVLSIAGLRTLFFLLAFYFWWAYTHPSGQSSALIGASAVVAIALSAMLTPVLRDLAYGGVMMAEHWFGVGDYVRIDPFADMEGVVERITLRSTRIRSINGEVMWVSNQNIQAVRLTPKGIRTMAVELLVSNIELGLRLVDEANLRLPNSPLMLVSPLQVMSKQKVGNDLWHITVIGETAPGREWVIEDYAIKIIKEIDEQHRHHILLHDPITRYADSDAERKFARTIKNARKTTVKRVKTKPTSARRQPIRRRFIS